MRTTVIVAAILLLNSSLLFAQEGFRAGLKGGPQSTWMFNADESNDSDWLYVHTLRSVFGATFGYNFNPGLGVQLDFLYSAQGQKFIFNDVSANRRLNYFKIPILLNLNSSPDGTAFAYLNVGPQFGFLVGSSYDQDAGFITLSDLSTGNTYKTLNIAAVLAFGAGFNLTDFLQLTTGIRLDFAFTDAEDKDSIFFAATPNRPATYNATGAFEVGLRYVLRTGE